MTPRSYTLGKRAATTASTRRRILDATTDLYREHGVAGTTLAAVAERADVSRGTILHHFGSADGLLSGVLDDILESLELPDADALNGIEGLDARVEAFMDGMIEFQERSSHWWSLFWAEMHRPELQKREAAYNAIVAKLKAAALGPELRRDAAANAALAALLQYATVESFLSSFEQAGLAREEGRRLLVELAVNAVRRIAGRRAMKGGLA